MKSKQFICITGKGIVLGRLKNVNENSSDDGFSEVKYNPSNRIPIMGYPKLENLKKENFSETINYQPDIAGSVDATLYIDREDPDVQKLFLREDVKDFHKKLSDKNKIIDDLTYQNRVLKNELDGLRKDDKKREAERRETYGRTNDYNNNGGFGQSSFYNPMGRNLGDE